MKNPSQLLLLDISITFRFFMLTWSWGGHLDSYKINSIFSYYKNEPTLEIIFLNNSITLYSYQKINLLFCTYFFNLFYCFPFPSWESQNEVTKFTVYMTMSYINTRNSNKVFFWYFSTQPHLPLSLKFSFL